MNLYTHDNIRNLINSADAERRQQGAFICSPMVFKDLWLICDENGRFIMEDPEHKIDPPKVLGFPVVKVPGYKGLTFE
ncbi:hypothetical protein ROA7450_00383 [Roseovarius albus]|uniref:Phage capsid-like C-terminal domain-containing protein n=1 Tax=Roseovarius albus TaxID=1247867 RepID=A0A1X6YAY3_9RHOB|nr:phage major capsid protein [Roseovarius albus]SLN15921.1 hypothetical protein ROA7450_00383 [Roseovarius albus]